MRMRCTCCGRWTIEAVQYQLAARRHSGPLLVLRLGQGLIGEYRTVEQLRAGLAAWPSAPRLDQFEETDRAGQ